MSLPRMQTKKQLQDFNNEVVEMLEFYGAKKTDSDTNYFNRIMYEMNSEKIGKLTIVLDHRVSRIYSIYAHFEDVDKAVKHFNCDSFNGKYNSHEFAPEPCLAFIDHLLDKYNQINGIDSHKKYTEVAK